MRGARQSIARRWPLGILFTTNENENGLYVTLNRLRRAQHEKITPQSAERYDQSSAHPLYLRADKLIDTKQIHHPLL
jgi:hypothetical protein